MKRNLISSIVFMLMFTLTAFNDPEVVYPYYPDFSINRGEVLEFKVSYGFIAVGKAQMKVGKNLYPVNERICYKVDINGKTTGAIDWVAKVNDNWGAYVDTAAILPHIAYRNIEEGNYRKKELVKFDHKTDMIEAKSINNKTGEFKEPLYHQAPDNVRDLISGYMLFRGVDFSNFQINDTLKIDAFFEDTVYDFQVLFKGREEVNTKLGKINAIKLVPIMPDNKLFDGENSITTWFSDDLNKIPLKVEANMFIGSAGVELISALGVKHPINFAKIKKAGESANDASHEE